MKKHAPSEVRPSHEPIPDKLYFKIGEVARITGVQPYILRYWESEFSVLQPKKSGTGQRLYRKKDIQTVLKIKHLLYDQKFTIAGAKRRLLSEGGGEAPADLPEILRRLREGLEGLAALLRRQ